MTSGCKVDTNITTLTDVIIACFTLVFNFSRSTYFPFRCCASKRIVLTMVQPNECAGVPFYFYQILLLLFSVGRSGACDYYREYCVFSTITIAHGVRLVICFFFLSPEACSMTRHNHFSPPHRIRAAQTRWQHRDQRPTCKAKFHLNLGIKEFKKKTKLPKLFGISLLRAIIVRSHQFDESIRWKSTRKHNSRNWMASDCVGWKKLENWTHTFCSTND